MEKHRDKKNSKLSVRFCPKCKSLNVNIQITASAAFGAPQQWRCLDCGFKSFSIFPEKEIKLNELKTKKGKNGERKNK